MFGTTVGGSFSKNDLESSSSRMTENFLRKRSSTSSSKSPGKEDIPPDKRLRSSVTGNWATKNSAEHTGVVRFSSVNENRGSSVIAKDQGSSTKSKDATVIDIGPPDSSDDYQNRGKINKVPNITVTAPSNKGEHYEPQGLERGSSLRGISSQFFDICKRESIDQGISFLHKNNYLYDVLLLQNEEDQDTPLHVAIKERNVDLVKKFLHILEKPYNLDDFYKYSHFSYNRNPLSKVINTKNREGKDVITLVIEGNNPECISAVFKYLTREDINRRKDIKSGYTPLHEAVRSKSSNAVSTLLKSEHVEVELLDKKSYEACDYVCDKETAKLFINFYDDKITNLRKRLEDSNIQLEQAKRILCRNKLAFAYLELISFCFQVSRTLLDLAMGLPPVANFFFHLFSSPPGLMVYLIHRTNEELLRHEEENSSLKKEFNSCIERRKKLEDKLHHFQERESHRAMSERLLSMSSELQGYREENKKLEWKLPYLEERTSCGTQINSVPTQMTVLGRDNVFNSPSTHL
ncbi:MAG: ankyrin repeat domain-containing protein [Wolbachia sp.]